MLTTLLLVTSLSLAGCASLLKPVDLPQLPVFEAVPLPELIAVEPVDLVAGEAAPHDGALLAAADLGRLLDYIGELEDHIVDLERHIENVRWLFTQREAALLDAVAICRRRGLEKFGAGAAVGVAACMGVGWLGESQR